MVRFHATAYTPLVRVEVPTNRSEVTSEDAKGSDALVDVLRDPENNMPCDLLGR